MRFGGLVVLNIMFTNAFKIARLGNTRIGQRGLASQTVYAARMRYPRRSAAAGLTAAAGFAAFAFSGSASSEGSETDAKGTDKFSHTKLYPPIAPYDRQFIKVSDLHKIHVSQYGNPAGKPVLFVHGGPGGGTDSAMARYFDPAAYRIILVDQRGCGESTPFAELKENTTWDLVRDFELIRKKLEIEQWLVFGGSWGSTLSLSYAVTHPERVKGLILRGIFLLRKSEIDWFYQNGQCRGGLDVVGDHYTRD